MILPFACARQQRLCSSGVSILCPLVESSNIDSACLSSVYFSLNEHGRGTRRRWFRQASGSQNVSEEPEFFLCFIYSEAVGVGHCCSFDGGDKHRDKRPPATPSRSKTSGLAFIDTARVRRHHFIEKQFVGKVTSSPFLLVLVMSFLSAGPETTPLEAPALVKTEKSCSGRGFLMRYRMSYRIL